MNLEKRKYNKAGYMINSFSTVTVQGDFVLLLLLFFFSHINYLLQAYLSRSQLVGLPDLACLLYFLKFGISDYFFMNIIVVITVR